MSDNKNKEPVLQLPPGYFQYLRVRLYRAWNDMWQAVGARMKLAFVSAACLVIAACIVHFYVGKPEDMGVVLYSQLFIFMTAVGGLVLTCLWYLSSSFLAAPFRIYREDQTKIAELEKVREQRIEGLRADFAQTFHSCADTREKLWNILDVAFARQRGGESDSGSVREFMKEVEFPESILKIRQHDSLYDYAVGTREIWGGKKKEFFEFCLALYQQEGDYPSLDEYRRALAKFWDDWERRCESQEVSVCDMVGPDLIQSQTPDVVMLTYLEVARGLHKKENSRGKQGLFTVAKEFREFSNS